MADRRASHEFQMSCLGVDVAMHCNDGPTLGLLRRNFGAMERPSSSPDLRYEISRQDGGAAFEVRRTGWSEVLRPRDTGELIFVLEGDLIVQLQLMRRQYLCIHAAVLAFDGAAHLLAGQSGAGKSTTCWGLLNHGFDYLSDEFAPLDVDNGSVHAYPHALCVKRRPPSDYPLPAGTLETSRGFHVPVNLLPAKAAESPLPLRSVTFVQYDATLERSSLTPVSHGQATARFYPNILNALAHRDAGFEVAANMLRGLPCFKLDSAGLNESCALLGNAIVEIGEGRK